MKPSRVYYEPDSLRYPLGMQLKRQFSDVEWVPIDNHNNIEELRTKENKEFQQLKRLLIVGIRKTHKYVENNKVSDYLVPFTSSGCTAMCLYCYLVCNYNKCSYLRLFVNREQMMDRLIKQANSANQPLCYEIGSNSDMILENTITGNLPWIIDEFVKRAHQGTITFPTKFDMVDSLLDLRHEKRVIFRMSLNPQEIITNVEIGTAALKNRITALNKMADAGYPIGVLIAPIIMVDNWKDLYLELLDVLWEEFSPKVKEQVIFEVIFMTYSFVQHKINTEAFGEEADLYDKSMMTGRGMGKYHYRKEPRVEGELFLRDEIERRFGTGKILYVC